MSKPTMGTILAGLLILSAAAECPAQVKVEKEMQELSVLDISAWRVPAEEIPGLFRQVLVADLERSGYFRVVSGGRAEYALRGQVALRGDHLVAECEAYNAASQERHLARAFRGPAAQVRRLAHEAADAIVLALTGRPGMAASRLALVGNRSGHKELYLCDTDGQNLRPLTRDRSLSLSPKWGPAGDRLVYTSYRSGFPDVYLITFSGEHWQGRRLAGFPGLNACAAISPDGRELALTLSKDGNPDLYIMSLANGGLVRLTRTPQAAEASPSWSPDGRRLVFVSDRSGRPELYLLDRGGGEPRRLTSEGSQNVDPDWGANNFIAYSSLRGGLFQLCILNPETLETVQLTPGDAAYEDPCWAPDRRHLACVRNANRQVRIFIVDMITRSIISLLPDAAGAGWTAPAWSPK